MRRATFERNSSLRPLYGLNGETKGLLYDTKEKITNKKSLKSYLFTWTVTMNDTSS